MASESVFFTVQGGAAFLVGLPKAPDASATREEKARFVARTIAFLDRIGVETDPPLPRPSAAPSNGIAAPLLRRVKLRRVK